MRHLTASWSRLAMPMDPPDDLTMHHLEGQAFGHGPAVVAVSGGEVIGHLSTILEGRTLYDQEWIVDLVYVVPAWRRKGIGSLLFTEMAKYKPGLRHSDYRSDLGDAWALARSKGEAVERGTQIPTSEAERIGVIAHDRIVREMRGLLVAASRRITGMADTLEDVMKVLERQIKDQEAAEVYTKTVEHRDAGRIGKQFPNRLAAWAYLRDVVSRTIPGFDPEWIEVMGAYATATAMVGWDPASKKAIFFLRDDAMNELVLLHEVAHLVLQYRGESDGHGPRFRQVCTDLYRKHLGFALFGRRT